MEIFEIINNTTFTLCDTGILEGESRCCVRMIYVKYKGLAAIQLKDLLRVSLMGGPDVDMIPFLSPDVPLSSNIGAFCVQWLTIKSVW